MIRHELKVDPIGYVSKNLLEGTALNNVERLYVINKCPYLFPHINNTSRLDERLYLIKMRPTPKDIVIGALKYNSNVKKALRMSPSLCANLDFDEYREELNHAIGKIKLTDSTTFISILDNPTADKDIIRKILMFRPDLLPRVKNIKMFDEDSDLQIFIFKCNPLLIPSFEKISENTVFYIINDSVFNVRFLNKNSLNTIDSSVLSKLLNDYMLSVADKSYDSSIVETLINGRQEVFTSLIETLVNHDGFSSNVINDIIVKRLLREFNNMIDDEVAEIVIGGKL